MIIAYFVAEGAGVIKCAGRGVIFQVDTAVLAVIIYLFVFDVLMRSGRPH